MSTSHSDDEIAGCPIFGAQLHRAAKVGMVCGSKRPLPPFFMSNTNQSNDNSVISTEARSA